MVREIPSGLGQDLVKEHLGLVLGALLGEGDLADNRDARAFAGIRTVDYPCPASRLGPLVLCMVTILLRRAGTRLHLTEGQMSRLTGVQLGWGLMPRFLPKVTAVLRDRTIRGPKPEGASRQLVLIG
jgi:hypothetical protein